MIVVMCMIMVRVVVIGVLVFGIAWDVVMMEAEKSLDEEHGQHAGEKPRDDRLNGLGGGIGDDAWRCRNCGARGGCCRNGVGCRDRLRDRVR